MNTMRNFLGSVLGGVIGAVLLGCAVLATHGTAAAVIDGTTFQYSPPLSIANGGTSCGTPDPILGTPCFVDGKSAQEVAGTKTFDQTIIANNGVVAGNSYFTNTSALVFGDLMACADSATCSRVPPMYGGNSVVEPATMHGAFIIISATLNGACAPAGATSTSAKCALSANTATLTGTAAPFVAGTSYSCTAYSDGTFLMLATATSGTTVTENAVNISGASQPNLTAATYQGWCFGW